MVAPAIPLIYWGYAILFAGGATIAARRILDEDDIGRIELPESIAEALEGRPQRQALPKPERDHPIPFPVPYDEGTEKRAKKRCEDDPEQDCMMCKALSEGSSVTHRFDGGEVHKPSPKARGSLYQHFVVPWFLFVAEEVEGNLQIEIEEWNWKLGEKQSWDGLVFSECKLLECKLGYRDFIHPDFVGKANGFTKEPGPWLPSLEEEWTDQLTAQRYAVLPDFPEVQLQWVFSDSEVMWQFVNLRQYLEFHEVDNLHVPYHLAPDGTKFLRARFSGEIDKYGYWRDN